MVININCDLHYYEKIRRKCLADFFISICLSSKNNLCFFSKSNSFPTFVPINSSQNIKFISQKPYHYDNKPYLYKDKPALHGGVCEGGECWGYGGVY